MQVSPQVHSIEPHIGSEVWLDTKSKCEAAPSAEPCRKQLVRAAREVIQKSVPNPTLAPCVQLCRTSLENYVCFERYVCFVLSHAEEL